MRIYGLKNCDTCRKAAKTLDGATLVDVRDAPLEPAFLQSALDQFGDALVNTRSTTWRGLSAEDRATDPLALLQQHPALMKRPLIEDASGKLHLGWGKDVLQALS